MTDIVTIMPARTRFISHSAFGATAAAIIAAVFAIGPHVMAGPSDIPAEPVTYFDETVSEEPGHIVWQEVRDEMARVSLVYGGAFLIGRGCGPTKEIMIALEESHFSTAGCETVEVAPLFTE